MLKDLTGVSSCVAQLTCSSDAYHMTRFHVSCHVILVGHMTVSITTPWLGFLRGVFLANTLASNDNSTRTTKSQNT